MRQDGYLRITIWTWIASVTFAACVCVWSTSGPVLSFHLFSASSSHLPLPFPSGSFLDYRWYLPSVNLSYSSSDSIPVARVAPQNDGNSLSIRDFTTDEFA